jgi:hypothetical protein
MARKSADNLVAAPAACTFAESPVAAAKQLLETRGFGGQLATSHLGRLVTRCQRSATFALLPVGTQQGIGSETRGTEQTKTSALQIVDV